MGTELPQTFQISVSWSNKLGSCSQDLNMCCIALTKTGLIADACFFNSPSLYSSKILYSGRSTNSGDYMTSYDTISLDVGNDYAKHVPKDVESLLFLVMGIGKVDYQQGNGFIHLYSESNNEKIPIMSPISLSGLSTPNVLLVGKAQRQAPASYRPWFFENIIHPLKGLTIDDCYPEIQEFLKITPPKPSLPLSTPQPSFYTTKGTPLIIPHLVLSRIEVGWQSPCNLQMFAVALSSSGQSATSSLDTWLSCPQQNITQRSDPNNGNRIMTRTFDVLWSQIRFGVSSIAFVVRQDPKNNADVRGIRDYTTEHFRVINYPLDGIPGGNGQKAASAENQQSSSLLSSSPPRSSNQPLTGEIIFESPIDSTMAHHGAFIPLVAFRNPDQLNQWILARPNVGCPDSGNSESGWPVGKNYEHLLHQICFDTKRTPLPPIIYHTIRVTVLRATDVDAKDLNGKSDPYCVVKLAQYAQEPILTTKVQKKTLNPVWNESVEFQLLGNFQELIQFKVFDKDLIGKDELIGTAMVASVSWLVLDRSHELTLDLTSETGTKSGTLFVLIEKVSAD